MLRLTLVFPPGLDLRATAQERGPVVGQANWHTTCDSAFDDGVVCLVVLLSEG